jgi:hypothetical protein
LVVVVSEISLEHDGDTWIATATGWDGGHSADYQAQGLDPLTAMTLLARGLHLGLQEAIASGDFEHGQVPLNDPRFIRNQ